ncbi:MAG: hypothetical protein WAW02_15375 [Sideroxyarcus sp.]
MNPHTYKILTLISTTLFFWLLIFLAVAWVVNAVLKRKVVNGAMFFLLVGGILFVIHFVSALHLQLGAKGLGEVIGTYFLPALLGFYLARRFEKQKNVLKGMDIET